MTVGALHNTNSSDVFKRAVEKTSYQGDKSGVKGKVKAFGHSFVARGEYLNSFFESVLDVLSNLGRLLYRSIAAAISGKPFANKELRDRAWASLTDLGKNFETMMKSLLGGLIYPDAAKALEKKVHPKQNESGGGGGGDGSGSTSSTVDTA